MARTSLCIATAGQCIAFMPKANLSKQGTRWRIMRCLGIKLWRIFSTVQCIVFCCLQYLYWETMLHTTSAESHRWNHSTATLQGRAGLSDLWGTCISAFEWQMLFTCCKRFRLVLILHWLLYVLHQVNSSVWFCKGYSVWRSCAVRNEGERKDWGGGTIPTPDGLLCHQLHFFLLSSISQRAIAMRKGQGFYSDFR